jgi:hypothetical protein
MCQWSWCVCVAVRSGRGWCEVSKFLRCISGFEKSAPFPPPLVTIKPVDKKRHHDVLVQKTKVQ